METKTKKEPWKTKVNIVTKISNFYQSLWLEIFWKNFTLQFTILSKTAAK
jgi:hypothetical protein